LKPCSLRRDVPNVPSLQIPVKCNHILLINNVFYSLNFNLFYNVHRRLKLQVKIIPLYLVLYMANVGEQITVDVLSPVQISVTASKVAGARFVIEAVTGVQISVTASKVSGTGFVIEAVTGVQILVTASKVAGTGFVIEAVTVVQFSVTASKVAGTGFVIEAVTVVQFLVTASKVRGTGFVIEAVTNQPVLFMNGTPFSSVLYLVVVSRGHRGGIEGVSRAFRGGFEGPGPPNPLETPTEPSPSPLYRANRIRPKPGVQQSKEYPDSTPGDGFHQGGEDAV